MPILCGRENCFYVSMGLWFRYQFNEYVRNVLRGSQILRRGFLKKEATRQVIYETKAAVTTKTSNWGVLND